MMNSLWWGSKNNSRDIHWISWDRLTFKKEFGGMGFRNLHIFNLSMLGKQGWRFISHPDVMVTKVFKVEYFSNVNLLDANLGHNPSFVWHRVFASQVVIREGFRWRLGRGNSITIWKQPWLKT
ncbi:hypothetical protein AAZV13_17G170900 [Glycine max]